MGADAVVGAHIRDRMITMGSRGKGGDDGGEVIEFTVVGTAVRAPFLVHPPGQPIVTDLSGQDLWALVREGWEPCCFLFEFCRFHGWHVTSGTGGYGELDDAKQVVDQARADCGDADAGAGDAGGGRVRRRERPQHQGPRGAVRLREVHARRPRRGRELVRHRHPPDSRPARGRPSTSRRSCCR